MFQLHSGSGPAYGLSDVNTGEGGLGYERRLDVIEFIAICKAVDANLFDILKANL